MRNFIFLMLLAGIMGCKVNSKSNDSDKSFEPSFVPGPHMMVYKTKADYEGNVHVGMDADKATIVSYPHPDDLLNEGEYRTPTPLKQGYLLDNKGIGVDAAFLDYTYGQYADLETAPSIDELNASIIDKDPLTELCDCGHIDGFEDVQHQLNDLIESGQLREVCKVLK